MNTTDTPTEMPTPTLDSRLPRTTLAGTCFLLLAGGFMTVLMLAAAMAPSYDFGGGAISDLGVIAETALLFNVGLLAVGVLNLLGGWLLYRAHGRRWLLGLYAVATIGAIGTGLFPLDTDPHSLFALLAFLGFNLEAIGTAQVLTGPMRIVAIVAGVLGLAFIVVMVIGDAGNPAVFGPIGHGGAERMIVYPVMLWVVAFGGYLLGTDGTPTID
ncbi:DUF998 domain-containing protein [Halorhabdus salina]|uniref:DUF998 domain-containing protein n=1 Tax=Halorhabdus salina TaxID=2750670 RepID=UPI00215D6983|nr:DUF998 domain-containing protein [Halorhabdus salina]